MHLFSKENIWSNPQQFPAYNPVIQTRTIILWTELFPKKRREKIQGQILQSSSSTVVSPQFYKNYTKSNIPTSFPVIPCYSTYRINSSTRILQEILQLQGSSRVIPCRLLPATVPRVSRHSTRQNKAPGSLTAFQGHTALAGFQLILPSRNSILSGSQHPRTPYSTFQANFTGIHLVLQKILPGEIGFFPKGLSIVYPIQY